MLELQAFNQLNSHCALLDSIYYLLNNYLIWKVFLHVGQTPPRGHGFCNELSPACVFQTGAGPECSCLGGASSKAMFDSEARQSQARLLAQELLANRLITRIFLRSLLKDSAWGRACYLLAIFWDLSPGSPKHLKMGGAGLCQDY